jgi:hypothetical protein
MSYHLRREVAGVRRHAGNPTLTAEEKYWVEKMKELLVEGIFHDSWGRLKPRTTCRSTPSSPPFKSSEPA